MVDINNAKSILKLENLYFESFQFENSGLEISEKDNNPEICFACQTFDEDENGFSIRLRLDIHMQEYYRLVLSLIGVFTVEGGFNKDNAYLRDNAVAIMYPYIRSQVTILTAQPGLLPIVLPPLNIKALLSDADKCEEKSTPHI